MNDKLEQLYNLYKQNGIIQSTDLNTFSAADDNQRKKLYELGKQKGLFKTTDYNTFNSAFSPIKKKEPTDSNSPSGQKPTSSDTPVKKPSGQSVSSYEVKSESKLADGSTQKVIYGDAGKGSRAYALRVSPDGRQSWYEYSHSGNPQKGDTKDYFDKPITDPNRVSTLNQKFGYKASTVANRDIYTGYPGKEQNEYRVSELQNGQEVWEVRRKGQDVFTTISDPGSISSLNREFDKSVKSTDDAKQKREAQLNRQKSVEDFKLITGETMDASEESLVEDLKDKYKGRGFTFNEVGKGNAIDVLVNDGSGRRATFYLNNSSDETNKSEALKLRTFLQENQILGDYVDLEKEEERKAKSEYKGLTQVDFQKQMQRLQGAGSQAEFEMAKSQNLDEFIGAGMAEKSQEAKDLRKDIVRGEYNSKQKIADITRVAKTEKDREEIAAIAKANQDEFVKRYWINDNYVNDLAETSKVVDQKFKVLNDDVNSFNESINDLSEEEVAVKKAELESRYNSLLEEGKDIRSEIGKVGSIEEQNQKDAALYLAYNETRGSVSGGLLNSAIKGVFGILGSENAETLAKSLGSEMTTDEFMQSDDRLDITKAAFSVTESLGAMATSLLTGGAATAGNVGKLGVSAAKTLPFFAMSYNEIKSEMNTDEFKDVPAWQKEGLAIIYGLGVGYLDKVSTTFGVKGVPANIARNTIFRAISGLEKGATTAAIESAITAQFKKDISAGLIKIAGGALVEGATEGTQSLYGSGLKKAFNYMQGEDKFNVDNWASDAATEAYMGALGGLIMSVPSGTVRGIKNGFNRMSPEYVELSKKVIEDSNLRSMVTTDIKTKLMSGKITKEEAKEQLDAIKEASGLFDKMPNNLSPESTAKSFDLIVERSKIEKEISGKEDNLVVAQKERIKEINTELQNISTDAVQKQTTSEVPVQPETKTSKEVVQGKPKSGPEVVTEKGKKEEIDAKQAQFDKAQFEVSKKIEELQAKGLTLDEIEYNPEYLASREKRVAARAELDALKQPTETNTATDAVSDTVNTTESITEGIIEADPKTYSDALVAAKAEMSKEGPGLDLQVSDVTEQEAKDIINEGGKVFMTSDGKAGAYVKKDGYMGGLFKSPKSEMKEVAKVLQDARIKAGGYFMDAYGTKLEDIYIKNGFRPVARLKFNEEYAPEGWNADGSPLKDKPDVVFFAYDPKGEYSKGDGEYVDEYDTAYEMAKSYKNVAKEVEAIGQLLSGTNQEIDQKASKVVNKKISKSVATAAKSISKVSPDTKFVVHDTDESYRSATKEDGKSQSSNGEFNPDTNTIHINGTKANSKTVAHEVFHAILINKVKTDENAAAVTKRMVQAISSKIDNNPSLKKKLDNFVSNYDENIQNEEKLAELVGILAENYNSFSAQIKDIITRWINKLASMFKQNSFDKNETYDILNVIARKIAKGDEISDADVKLMNLKTDEDIESSTRKQLSIEVSNKLTEDKKGNFIFHHYSGARRNEINPGMGENIITGKEESGALSAVGGLAMYYTMDNQVEPGVGNTLHTVLVPKGKVYDFNQDPENFYDEAKKRFEGVRPSQSFSPNYQLAFITQVANENGYDMVVARWRNNELRAQTTIPLKPSSENIRMKPIEEESFKVGDDVEVYGSKGKVVSIDGDIITFKGDGVGGEINFKRFPKNISKQITPRKQITQEVSGIEENMTERKQKVTSINDIVRITKDKGFSDAAIRQYLKDQGFSDKQATAAINEYNVKKEGIFVRKDGGIPTKIVDSIRSFRRRMLSARSFLPKSVFASREDKDASVARHLNIVDQNVKDFNRLYAKYKGDKDALVAEFDKYIRGDKDAKLPEEFMAVANSMRNQIDGLSMQLINNGLVDADMAQTIKDNLGQYLTRSYKIYDRDNWKKEVEDEVKQKAINLLKSQYREMAQEISDKEGIPLEEVLDNLVTNRLDEMLTTEGAKNFITGSKLGSKDLSVLKERQDIPVEIRMLLGEYSDPALNYAKTVLKLSSLAANHKFLTEVKKNGAGVYLFEKNDPRRPADFNTMIATEGSESMNPLNGMYTTKEIADAFMAQPSQLSDFWKTFMKFQSTVRWLKTIGSVATHIKNVFGNIGFIWINSHFDPKEIRKSYTTIKEDLMPYGTYLERGRRKVLGQKQKEVDEVARKMMNNYIALGIVKQSAGLGEIMDMFKDANWDIAMASRLSNQKLGLLGKAKRIFLQGKKKIEDAYQAEDDFFKIVAYENELSRYSEAMFGKKKSELTEEELAEVNKVVTEIVKNTYPTYDRIPEAVKMVRRAPFIGNFVSFQAESYRTAFNTMALAKNELMSDNNKIKAIGAQRLAGATTYLSAKSAILAYFSMAAGTGLTGLAGYLFDDEDEDKRDKDIRKFVAPWSEKSDLLMISVGDGKMKYIDFSSSDPHGGMKKVLNAFFLGETTIDSFSAGIVETFAPFIGEDMTVEALLALKNNQDKYGNPIYNTEESLKDQSEKVLSYMYKLVEPGTFSSIRRGMEAEDKTNELVANLTGFRTYDVDINKQFGYKMKDYSERISNAKKIYNQAYFNEKTTEADKEKAYKKAQESLNGIYTEITEVYNSAERLGCDPKDLGTVMADFGNMSKRTVRDIQSGSLPELKKKD